MVRAVQSPSTSSAMLAWGLLGVAAAGATAGAAALQHLQWPMGMQSQAMRLKVEVSITHQLLCVRLCLDVSQLASIVCAVF